MTCRGYTKIMLSPFKSILFASMILFAAGVSHASANQAADSPVIPGGTADTGIWLAACTPPPLPTRGCIRNPCDGKYICCSQASGRPKCVVKDAPK